MLLACNSSKPYSSSGQSAACKLCNASANVFFHVYAQDLGACHKSKTVLSILQN